MLVRFALLAALVVAALAMPRPAHAEERRALSGEASGVARAAFDDGAGNVTVRAGAGREIRVDVDVRGDDAGAVADVRLERTVRDGVATFAVRFPPGSHAHLRADLMATVPAGTDVEARTGLGNVRVDDAHAVVAHSGMGDIDVRSVASTVEATSGMGNVDVALARGWRGASVRASTGMGNVGVTVPEGTPIGRVEARSGMGRASSAVPSLAAGAPLRAQSGMGNVSVDRG